MCLTLSNVLVSWRCALALLKPNLTPALTKCLVSLLLCELLPLRLGRESLLRVLLACVVGVFKKSCLKPFAVHCVISLPRFTVSMRLAVCCVTASLTVILTLSSAAMAIACSLLSRRPYKHCVVSASHLLAHVLHALKPFEVTHVYLKGFSMPQSAMRFVHAWLRMVSMAMSFVCRDWLPILRFGFR